MPRKPRIHYTEADKALMWDRWRKAADHSRFRDFYLRFNELPELSNSM